MGNLKNEVAVSFKFDNSGNVFKMPLLAIFPLIYR